MEKHCPYCKNVTHLVMSHSIPKAAFTSILKTGNGNMLSIPKSSGNIEMTRDTGAARLLCDCCERNFNSKFDASLINALKSLENKIMAKGPSASIEFEANKFAHAVVSIAWRICLSTAPMYKSVALSEQDLQKLDAVLRLPTSEVLRNCTVRLGRIWDNTPALHGGFSQESMGKFIKIPKLYTVETKSTAKPERFAIDWTMFGFIFHLVMPQLNYPRSKHFKGLKRDATQIRAVPDNIFKYPPIKDALVAGYSAYVEGRMSPKLKK